MNKSATPIVLLIALSFSSAAQDGPPKENRPLREPDLVELTTLDPTIKLDIRYASDKNDFHRPFYSEARAFLQRPAAEALARVNASLKSRGYGLLVFDGYRPWAVTKQFWDLTPKDKKIFVADPGDGSRHNRGCAVDLTMYDLATGKPVEMPGGYDEMSPRSYVTYEAGPEEPRKRKEILRKAMESEGFFVYPWEWWHYDYRDWRDYPVLDIPFASLGRARAGYPEVVNLKQAKVVDLTHAFEGRTLYWPTSPSAFELKTLARGKTPGGFFYASNSFCTPEHGGTHLDAPVHFSESGESAEAIPLARLIAPAVVIDVSEKAAKDPDYRLSSADLLGWEATHGIVPKGAIVLLRTGWSSRWPDRKRYFGDDTPNDASHLHFPSYGAEAVQILVKERGVAALGVDTASIDYGPSQDFPVHRVAAAAQVPGLENLKDLHQLPASGFWIAALPMKIGGGTGGPLRIVAIVP
jgi:kynurenine formamidase/D-alanyl-D-alanine dipeptidase